ncbi:MAG: isoprenylcysteine carboxylmethyltransferase family protein [Eubacteriales bacterium]|nr:isoprenylcysteine carboxylmethyltransferase family protein [Eubacteriales bacterium]
MNQEKDHLPVTGYGPYFILAMGAVTVLCVVFIHTGIAAPLGSNCILYHVFGIPVILVGIVIYLMAAFQSRIVKRIRAGELVTTGIYGYVRNPIYCGILYVFFGVLLLQQNAIAFIAFGIYWVSLTVFLKKTEEQWLQKRYGKEFEDYMRRVNRFIVWPGKKSR